MTQEAVDKALAASLPQGWSVVEVVGNTTKVWPMTEAQITSFSLAEPPEQEPVQKPAAVVSSCTGGVRVKWLGGFPQIGDRLYTRTHDH